MKELQESATRDMEQLRGRLDHKAEKDVLVELAGSSSAAIDKLEKYMMDFQAEISDIASSTDETVRALRGEIETKAVAADLVKAQGELINISEIIHGIRTGAIPDLESEIKMLSASQSEKEGVAAGTVGVLQKRLDDALANLSDKAELGLAMVR
jgi:hypothetical protein